MWPYFRGVDMNSLEQFNERKLNWRKRADDPLRTRVEATVRGMAEISAVALLDLIGLPTTTGNAGRIGKAMRRLGHTPIKRHAGSCRVAIATP